MAVMEVCALAQLSGLKVCPQLLVGQGSVRQICVELESAGRFDVMTAEKLREDVCGILKVKEAGDIVSPSLEDHESSAILLTGATGFLGARILVTLLRDTAVDLVCLVRGVESHHARQRLLESLNRNRIELARSDLDRVEVIAGDIALKKFGWTGEFFSELASRIDKVIHSAAKVNMVANYDSLRPANVVGVNRIADFVAATSTRKLDYISTLSVFVGTDRFQGAMLESDDLSRTARVYGGYAQSKWAAEVLLRDRTDIQTRFFRLGLLTADTETGVFPKMDLLTLAIKGLDRLGYAPNVEDGLKVDITPVNYAAEAIASISQQSTEPDTFHVAHPVGLSADALIQNVRAVCPHIKIVSIEQFEMKVKSAKLDWKTASACLGLGRALSNWNSKEPMPFDLFQATNAKFDMTNSSKFIFSSLKPPVLDDQFVQRLISQIVSNESQSEKSESQEVAGNV